MCERSGTGAEWAEKSRGRSEAVSKSKKRAMTTAFTFFADGHTRSFSERNHKVAPRITRQHVTARGLRYLATGAPLRSKQNSATNDRGVFDRIR